MKKKHELQLKPSEVPLGSTLHKENGFNLLASEKKVLCLYIPESTIHLTIVPTGTYYNVLESTPENRSVCYAASENGLFNRFKHSAEVTKLLRDFFKYCKRNWLATQSHRRKLELKEDKLLKKKLRKKAKKDKRRKLLVGFEFNG